MHHPGRSEEIAVDCWGIPLGFGLGTEQAAALRDSPAVSILEAARQVRILEANVHYHRFALDSNFRSWG